MQIEELFVTILNMSITASYAILAVFLLRLLLRTTSKWITCVLWGIASFRLVFPFSLQSILSVFSVIPSSDTVTPEILYSQAPTIHSGIPALNSSVNPVISHSMAPAAGASVNPMQVIAYIASIIWLAGIAGLLVYSIISYINLRKKTMSATLLNDNVYQSENVMSPFLLGIIKPRIYVSYGMKETELLHVVRHENAHIARRDYLLKPLAFFILTLHWFNPLVWVAYILFCRDIELACDEKVIKSMSVDERKSYSEALLGLAMRSCRIPACPLAFGEVSVKDRVKKALSYKKTAFWIIVAGLAACVVTALCLLTDPVQKPEPGSAQNPDNNVTTISNTDNQSVYSFNDMSELFGTYLSTDVVYVNPIISYYSDEKDMPYYTFAEDTFWIMQPDSEEALTYAPEYSHSVLTYSEFNAMFELDVGAPVVSADERIEHITVTDSYSLFIAGSELWLADISDEHIRIMYRLEPSQYSPQMHFERLTLDKLEAIVSNKKAALTWSDFNQYEHYDIGSGLYIWQLPIDENFCVLIGGGNADMDPMYVRLVRLYADGEMTDEHLDLLDENADVQGYVNSFNTNTEPTLTWSYIPHISSVFPALPIDIDMRYSTVDVTIDNGSFYRRGDGITHIKAQTYTYSFGETIFWSPHTEDSFEKFEDAAGSCTLSFVIKNSEDDGFASGKIYIEKTEQSDDYSCEYSITMIEAPEWLQLTFNTSDKVIHGFVLSIK